MNPSNTTLSTEPSDMEVQTDPSTSTLQSIQLPAPTKRKLVNVSGIELPDPKRNRAEPKDSLKMSAIYLLLHWHEYLCKEFKVTPENMNKIDTIADITSIIWTVHTKFRQQANGRGSIATLVTASFEFTANGWTVTWARIGPTMKSLAALYGFNYEINDAGKNATGTLGSILALIVSYRVRFNEVRVGTNAIVLKKVDGVVHQVPISQFGLRPEHAIMMTGSSYNPTVQSSMKGSLGPMTIAVNLAMQTDREYQNAWKRSFCQTFKLLGNVQEIANVLAGSEDKEASILTHLADISLFGVTTASNKAAFPFSFFLVVARRMEGYRTFFSKETTNTAIGNSIVHHAIRSIDFSGAGSYIFWEVVCLQPFRIKSTAQMTERIQKEMVFHAVWGTQKKDLSLLKYLTQHEFLTRKDIGKSLEKRGEGTEEQGFSNIKFIYVAKLANEAQFSFLSGGKGQICRAPVFSGRCNQRVDVESDYYKVLEGSNVQVRERLTGKPRIIVALNREKKLIADDLAKKMKVSYDTTTFFKFNATTGYGEIQTSEPDLSQVYFYGQNN